jgi:hypothetical protein
MEKAIVKFLFFRYSYFWYFLCAHLAHYPINHKQDGAISHFPVISHTRLPPHQETPKQPTKTGPQQKTTRSHLHPPRNTNHSAAWQYRASKAKTDLMRPTNRIKISHARTTIPTGKIPGNPKNTICEIRQPTETTGHKSETE